MATTILTQPFNAAQLELMQLFAGGLTDEQMRDLRRILLDFKFRRATDLADKFVDERAWTSDDIAKDAENILRTTYRAKNR
jgi:hypothetical protein